MKNLKWTTVEVYQSWSKLFENCKIDKDAYTPLHISNVLFWFSDSEKKQVKIFIEGSIEKMKALYFFLPSNFITVSLDRRQDSYKIKDKGVEMFEIFKKWEHKTLFHPLFDAKTLKRMWVK